MRYSSLAVALIALLVGSCATEDSRIIVTGDRYKVKTLQTSPYEVATWPQLRGISRRDIHQIEHLIAGHSEIRRPILRMFATRNDRVQVITGRDQHAGDVYNCFDVVRRGDRWAVDGRVVDTRTTKAELAALPYIN
jgi:hypothetical protein